jgi:hypothetical protein
MAKVKLSDIKFGDTVLINGMKHEFRGYEKRKTQFGKQEMFVFKNIEEKISEGITKERLFQRFNFSNTLIKKISENNYEWS